MSYNPGTGPYNNPQITINTPLAPPPQQFTNAATLVNGQYEHAGVIIFRNGLQQTSGFDFTRSGGLVTMVIAPGAGDIVTAALFAIGKQLGGNNPKRYIAPWRLSLAGAYDGVSLDYRIVFGPTISGACDGVNSVFILGVSLSRMQVFRNGLLQTSGVDICTGANSVVFLPGAVPVAGDLLTVLGY